jgi:hypothetical protein
MNSLLKDRVGTGKKVFFSHFTDGELWYTTEDNFLFPVPVADAGNATFLKEDKALYFMRYIRKHMDMLEKAKANV